jgi:hypothetical protein
MWWPYESYHFFVKSGQQLPVAKVIHDQSPEYKLPDCQIVDNGTV